MSGLHYLTAGNVFSVMQDSCNPGNYAFALNMLQSTQVATDLL